MIKECKELLKKGGKESNILVVSSIEGSSPTPEIGVYAMTKSALNNMVVWMATELREDDIRINSISPGLIATEFSGILWKENKDLNKKRLGTSEQIASVAATMCSQ